MSEVKYENMIEICKRFIDSDPIDFYYLFGIDKNMNLMEINKDIKNKKIRSIFHPDHIESGTIPEKYKQTYKKIVYSIPDLVNAFSTKENRKMYDKKLEESKNTSKEDETIIITKIDIANLEKAIIENAKKYNWEHTVNSLVEFLNNNNPKGFTRDNNARDYIKNLGQEKVRDIIIPLSFTDLDNNTKLDMEQIVINYISDIFQKNEMLKEESNALINAIETTLKKYDESQVKESILAYIKNNNITGITNDNNARTNLKRFVRPSDIDFMLRIINNQDRFIATANYYSNSKNQNTSYQLNLFISNIKTKNNMNQEYKSNSIYN